MLVSKFERFEALNNHTFTIINKLIENDVLCRLLYYSKERNAISRDINGNYILPELTEDDRFSLINTHIFPRPRNTETLEEQTSFICILFDDVRLARDNTYFTKAKPTFLIICHDGAWNINEGIRPLLIMNEINSVMSNSNDFGIGKTNLPSDGVGARFIQPSGNSNYTGYRLQYQNYDFS